MNQVNLVGRLTKDPLLKGNEQNKVCFFTVAVNHTRKNSKGQRGADFIPIKVFNDTAINCSKFLKKGSLVCVTAYIQTTSNTVDGNFTLTIDVIARSVQFLDSAPKKENSHDAGYEDPFPGAIPSNEDWPF